MSRPGAWRLCCIAILLNMACFRFSVCLEPACALRVVCDASLQTAETSASSPTPDVSRPNGPYGKPPAPPRERWPCSRNRILMAWAACKQSTGSLIWVFMFQPLSNRDERLSHRRWVLAPLTRITGEQKWQLRCQSLAVGAQRAVTYRPHMANAPLPPVAPMDDTYTYNWSDPSVPCGFLRPRL